TRESPSPRAEFLIAVAGPAASLGVGLIAALLSWTLWDVAPPVAALGLWLATMNIPLAIFNLVPAYPLDGGRVLRAVLWFAGQDAESPAARPYSRQQLGSDEHRARNVAD